MISLMTVLQWHAFIHPRREALVADGERRTYRELFHDARRLAVCLHEEYRLKAGDTVNVLCRNHLLSVLLLVALSRLGVHVRLLNTDVPFARMSSALQKGKLLLYDEEVRERCVPAEFSGDAISGDVLLSSLRDVEKSVVALPHICHVAQITVMTGGSSGQYKEASRSTSVWQFLSPFWALLRQVRIGRYRNVLIALPFYHGFGLSTLIVSLLLGKTVCLLRHFDASAVIDTIEREKIEVLPVVPAMLARMWPLFASQHESPAVPQLNSLRCIISGGDRLDRSLAAETMQHLGPILYNMYGTSEAGFMLLAKPDDLLHASDTQATLGRPISGVHCEVRDKDAQGIGSLWVRTGWAAIGKRNQWQCTGDRVWRDDRGYYYHAGRADRVVVCGGENVCLDEVERVINAHPLVLASSVYAVADVQFGQVLHAVVELSSSYISSSEESLTEASLLTWLKPQLSRAELPHKITFGPIALLPTGKRSLAQPH